ncbi:hypothetical protein [Pseudomonas sp. AB12(2023)]|uniref:hypothetical protein n=1 Tax=Pseudomonas sp. AB12(2023) TaxID=3048597 RepID=UPI002B221D15|nr:hypothetical protein [Pseudomonas sp. AB12(2023)]MEB0221355.1 hypothetical protein [Pseudomonas sp. AB12(2023)]
MKIIGGTTSGVAHQLVRQHLALDGETMFYESVKAAYKAGKVRVGLPALGLGTRVTIEANGLTSLKAVFLSDSERQKLAELSKIDAKITKSK